MNDAPTPAQQPQAPTQAAPTPPPQEDDPNVIGRLNEQEMGQWKARQRQGTNLVSEIGNMFVRAVRMAGDIGALESQITGILQGAAKRLGLPDDTRFQVTPDGRIRVIADVPLSPQQASPAPPAEAAKAAEVAQAAAPEKQAQVPAGAPTPTPEGLKAQAAVQAARVKADQAKEAATEAVPEEAAPTPPPEQPAEESPPAEAAT